VQSSRVESRPGAPKPTVDVKLNIAYAISADCARIFGDAVFLGETLDLTGTSQRSTCTHA
jgi:hypothetical protein